MLQTFQTQCEFSNPVGLSEMDYEYQLENCTTTIDDPRFEAYEVQINGTTTPFWYSKIISPSNVIFSAIFLIVGLTLFVLSIFRFVFKKKVVIEKNP